MALLKVKELNNLVNGKDPRPFLLVPVTDSPTTVTPEQQSRFDRKLLEWEKKNDKTVDLLLLNIDDGPQQHADERTDAKAIWDSLKNQYEAHDVGTRDLSFLAIT